MRTAIVLFLLFSDVPLACCRCRRGFLKLPTSEKSKTASRLTQRLVFKSLFRLTRPAFHAKNKINLFTLVIKI